MLLSEEDINNTLFHDGSKSLSRRAKHPGAEIPFYYEHSLQSTSVNITKSFLISIKILANLAVMFDAYKHRVYRISIMNQRDVVDE